MLNLCFQKNSNPTTILANFNDKISDIIKRYRTKSGDFNLSEKFMFNAKILNENMTTLEAGLNNGCFIYVIETQISNLSNENTINQLQNEIINLKNELKNKNQLIVQQQTTISNLQNKLYNIKNNNKILVQNMEKKEREIISLKNELLTAKNEIFKLKENIYGKNSSSNPGGKNFAINFLSIDNKINYPIICNNNTLISRLEEEVYNEFPEYKNYDTFLTSDGKVLKRFKSIGENGVKKGDHILINIYE